MAKAQDSAKLQEFRRLVDAANDAKERLAEISYRLEELGYAQKANSAMRLCWSVEEWQRRAKKYIESRKG